MKLQVAVNADAPNDFPVLQQFNATNGSSLQPRRILVPLLHCGQTQHDALATLLYCAAPTAVHQVLGKESTNAAPGAQHTDDGVGLMWFWLGLQKFSGNRHGVQRSSLVVNGVVHKLDHWRDSAPWRAHVCYPQRHKFLSVVRRPASEVPGFQSTF